jgi:hypothetical protein
MLRIYAQSERRKQHGSRPLDRLRPQVARLELDSGLTAMEGGNADFAGAKICPPE